MFGDFLYALYAQWVWLLTSTAIAIVLLIIQNVRGNFSWRTLATLLTLSLLPACFLAWKTEYEKNAGYVEIQYYLPYVTSPPDDQIDVKVTLINSTAKPVIIRELGLGRIVTIDKSENLSLNTPQICKKVNTSPQWRRSPIGMDGYTGETLGENTFFSYLSDGKTDIVVEANKSIVIPVQFHGEAIDLAKFNSVALCPAIVYLASDGTPLAAICEGDKYATVWGEKPPTTGGPDTLRFKIFPALETAQCRATFL